MHRRLLLSATACLALGGAGAAFASIPGNVQERAREGLQHVCVDREPGDADYVACEVQEGGFVNTPYTGEECAAVALPPTCEIDFIPKVRVKGKVTIVFDDLARTGGDADAGEQTALILELKVKGRKKVRIYELFEGSKLGNWNPIAFEDLLLQGGVQISDTAMTAYQFASDNLTDLGDKIAALVDPAYPKVDLSIAVPVVTRLERIDKKTVDASQLDPTATATVWKFTLEFARARD